MTDGFRKWLRLHRKDISMTRPENLIVGRVYFEILYEDENLRYPMIHAYEYKGTSNFGAEQHEFRIIGTNDLLTKSEEELESIENSSELFASLNEWITRNPNLTS